VRRTFGDMHGCPEVLRSLAQWRQVAVAPNLHLDSLLLGNCLNQSARGQIICDERRHSTYVSGMALLDMEPNNHQFSSDLSDVFGSPSVDRSEPCAGLGDTAIGCVQRDALRPDQTRYGVLVGMTLQASAA